MVGSHQVLSAEAEWFERRLTNEIGAWRAELHLEMATLRLETHDGFAAVRQEMSGMRVDMTTMRADILKWSFLFWIGQVATIAALLSFMLRASGR